MLAKPRRYAVLGIEAFILSGYPHATECDLFARHVLPHLKSRSAAAISRLARNYKS